MKFIDLKEELLRNKEFSDEYNKRDLGLEISELISRLRVSRGVTQETLAELLGTQQPSIARAERGTRISSISFLDRVGKALGAVLSIEYRDAETQTNDWNRTTVSPYYTAELLNTTTI